MEPNEERLYFVQKFHNIVHQGRKKRKLELGVAAHIMSGVRGEGPPPCFSVCTLQEVKLGKVALTVSGPSHLS